MTTEVGGPTAGEKRARLLSEAARQLGETLNPERVYERFHDLLGDTVSHDGIVVSSYDADENLIRCDYAWVDGNTIDPAGFPPLTPNPGGDGLQSRAIVSGESFVVNDVDAIVASGKGIFYTVDGAGRIEKVPAQGSSPTRAAILAPVKLAGRVVGVVQVMSDHTTYTDDQLEFVDALVAQMAAAVRNAKLYRRAQVELDARRRAEQGALRLQRATAALGRAVERQDVVDVLLEEALVASGADKLSVGLVEPSGATLEIVSTGETAFERRALPLEQPVLGAQALAGGEPLWFERAEDFDEAHPDAAAARAEQGWLSLALLPLVVDGRPAGFLAFGFVNARTFDEPWRAFLSALVEQCAQSIERVTAQEERRRLAAADEAGRAVANERAQAARVLAAMGDGVMLVGESGIVRLWNPAAERITGVLADDVVGRPIDEALPGWLAVRDHLDSGSTRAETVPLEVLGVELWLSFVAVESPDGVVLAFRDLTEERQLEKAKTDFVATVSHELRTPLAAVYGAARTLLRPDLDLDPERRRALLEMIAGQAQRLSDIAAEVLLASRLDAGEVPLSREPVDAGRVAAETVEAMRSRLADDAPLGLDVEPDVPLAAGDEDKLRQILVNLVDNAIKYSPEGTSVEVSVCAVAGRVRLSVTDHGPGIPRNQQERVFERFFRVDPNHARAPGGTGLGLYICRELARRMDGGIGLVSEEGEGSTFWVELPLADAPAA